MAIPPVSGSPIDPLKTKEVGDEEAKTPNVKEIAKNLIIPMGRPAPIKKAVQEAPPKEQGAPVGDSGIKLPPPPRATRGRMLLPGETADLPPPITSKEPNEPPPARAGRALPKTPAASGGMLAGLGESKLFKKQQNINNPDEAKIYLNDVAKKHNHEFHEEGSFFINLTTQDIVTTDEFKVIIADTSGDYALAMKLHNEWSTQAPQKLTREQGNLNKHVEPEATRQGYTLSPEGHFYKGSLEAPEDIKTAEEFVQDMKSYSVEKIRGDTPADAARYLSDLAKHYGYQFRSDLGVFMDLKNGVLINSNSFEKVISQDGVQNYQMACFRCNHTRRLSETTLEGSDGNEWRR